MMDSLDSPRQVLHSSVIVAVKNCSGVQPFFSTTTYTAIPYSETFLWETV
jgi:hypothetical protein